MAAPPPAESTILFRPSKKRKIYRQRPDDESLPDPSLSVASPKTPTSPALAHPNPQSIDELIASTAAALPPGSAGEGEEELEGTRVSMTEILRLRKRTKRIGGVEFRAEAGGHIARDEDGALVVRQGEPRPEGEDGSGSAVIRKFAPQTGTVGDVNKHM